MRNQESRRHEIAERAEPPLLRLVEQRRPVEVHEIEEVGRQRQRRAQTIDVQSPAEPLHRHLEGLGRAVRAERDDLAVEHQLAGRQGAHDLDDLGHRRRDVAQLPREDAHVVTGLVDLDACAVHFQLQRRVGAQLGEGGFDVIGRVREHRLDRTEQLQREAGRVRRCAIRQGRGGNRGQVARPASRPA